MILIFFYSSFHPGLTFTDLFLECTLTLPLKCSHYVFFFFLNQKWGLWSNRWFRSGQIWDCLEESRWLIKLFLGHFLVHVHNFENSYNLKCWVNNKDFWREWRQSWIIFRGIGSKVIEASDEHKKRLLLSFVFFFVLGVENRMEQF